jgi:hypothetical protein
MVEARFLGSIRFEIVAVHMSPALRRERGQRNVKCQHARRDRDTPAAGPDHDGGHLHERCPTASLEWHPRVAVLGRAGCDEPGRGGSHVRPPSAWEELDEGGCGPEADAGLARGGRADGGMSTLDTPSGLSKAPGSGVSSIDNKPMGDRGKGQSLCP